jgi:EAL domain-containing protein (putative c-di-GMP-specific phosphodiesterase class I)
LSFEISEAAIIADLDAARRFITLMREAGCPCSIDDFGTGATSLAYLASLPVTSLKIDGVFVRDLVHDRRAESMVRAILQIARQLELETVAENVESEAAASQLAALGVTYGQGIALGPPVPFDTVLADTLRQATPTLTDAVALAGGDPRLH